MIHSSLGRAGLLAALLVAALPATSVSQAAGQSPVPPASAMGLEYIDTSFENASPLWYDVVDNVVRIHLLYDHERASPNRAAGHIHFRIHARPGTTLTLEFLNLDNVWNGQPGSVAGELKTVAISEDGRTWKTVPTQSLPGNRVQLSRGDARPAALYRPHRTVSAVGSRSILASIRGDRLVQITPIGKTVAGRDLEIIRIGSPDAPYHVFVRARAHPWESGSNWVAQGLIQRLLKDDDESRRFLRVYSVSVMPMANKDGVARGGTRFNLRGKDLNRDWDKPANPELAPENAALERWLEAEIASGRRPHLALELHNDGAGRLHISRPPVPQLDRHLARMAIFEELLRKETWFTEGTTNAAFRNSGTLGDGWLERYGIDAAVHEFNCNWVEGLKDYTSSRHWMDYGAGLARVFHGYFERVKP